MVDMSACFALRKFVKDLAKTFGCFDVRVFHWADNHEMIDGG